jgi:hypothetical protein
MIKQPGRDWGTKCVIGEGKEQVLLDVTQSGPRQFSRGHNAHQIAAQKGDACTFHCYICPSAHCDANVGYGQGGGVVHTVTCHRDLVPLRAQFVDQRFFIFGKHARPHLVDAELATACAVRSLSPVAIITRNLCACNSLIARAVLPLIGSATNTIPASMSSTLTSIAVLPGCASRLRAFDDSFGQRMFQGTFERGV